MLVVGDFARKAGISESALKELAPRARLMRTVLKSEVLHLLTTTPVDLILAVSGSLLLATEELTRAMNAQPVPIPILVVSQTERDPKPLGEAVEHMVAPVELAQLQLRVHALLSARAQVTRIEGVSLPGFVQLVEMERRTCTLFVAAHERRGTLRFVDGRLVDARSPERSGDAAALEVFGWSGAAFALGSHADGGPASVHRGLTDLLLDAARTRDELARATRREAPVAVLRPYDLEFGEELFDAPANEPVPRRAERGAPATGPPARPPPDPAAPPAMAAAPRPPAADPPPPEPSRETATRRKYGENLMANVHKTMEEAMKIDGAIGVALADWESGLCLGTGGGGARLNLEVAAAGNCQVVKAKMATMSELGIRGAIQDILITLDDQVHLIRPLKKYENLFLYLAIDKVKGNLGMARHRLQKIESELML